MRAVIQRCSRASVRVDGTQISAIGAGMMILVCVETDDTAEELEWLARKIVALRIFDDDAGVMNLDIRNVGGEMLVVSQFTLLASTRKGNRPSYIRAAKGEESEGKYEAFCAMLEQLTGNAVGRGRFGADMKVELVNDGPVTIVIDSRLRE